MVKLTATQSLILKRASQRADRVALPLPNRLKGAAAKTVVARLIQCGLVSEVSVDACKRNSLWGQRQDGTFTTLVITDTGLVAIGVEVGAAQPDPLVQPKPRKGTKQAMLIDMLKKPEGATLEEITIAIGWQSHSVRGAISGGLRKRLGLTILSETVEGRGRIYRIVP
ncbi:MAG: DUF3489 domain-containing protein [Alphaproteobacteria bacterium]|nr:DUF3489 domain-containing protein [Alphaproteobacteria bacterium]